MVFILHAKLHKVVFESQSDILQPTLLLNKEVKWTNEALSRTEVFPLYNYLLKSSFLLVQT